jgi:hypothetical protein
MHISQFTKCSVQTPILMFVCIFTLNISFLFPTCLNTDKLTLGPAIRLVFSEEKTHVLQLPTCLNIDNLTLGPAIRLLFQKKKNMSFAGVQNLERLRRHIPLLKRPLPGYWLKTSWHQAD